MNKKSITFAVALLALPQLAAAQNHDLEAQLRPFLAPPELVMRYQRQLSLTEEQRLTIRRRITELQSEVQDIQWDLQDLSQGLVDIVRGDSVDVDAAISQFDQVLEAEAAIKRTHIRMLLEIRNILNTEQRRRLQEILEEMVHREMREEPAARRRPEQGLMEHQHRPAQEKSEHTPA